jgi:hypothetical protein
MTGKWQQSSLLHSPAGANRVLSSADDAAPSDEDSCPAFGYLRGLHDRALAVELRFRDGNRDYFPYSWLGPWHFNPSAGILLKFTGDAVTLVLIRGSNLDATVGGDAINLTDRGFQRHRISWVREMDEDELKQAGEGGPTIDRIEVEAFESADDMRAWVKVNAPAFLPRASGR